MNICTQLAKGKMHTGIALLAIGWLLIATPADAKRISQEQALKNAVNLMGSQMTLNEKSQLNQTRAASPTNAYYVFNSTDGKGYVIMSGDDAVRPVLGYSTQGTFDPNHLPEGLKDLLASYQKQIEALGDKAPTYQQTRAIDQSSTKVLTTAKWNQGSPFNQFTPNNYPTGCGATSLAIIMKYWGYPAKGIGSHSYVWNGQKLSADFSQHTYDWDKMPMEYKNGNNLGDFAGVARLMSDIGIAVEMNYAEDGSASNAYNLINALINNFGYSKYSKLLLWTSYTDDEWKKKVRNEIDEGRPVPYGSNDATQGGHIFVVDGYHGDQFSVNWGWGGAYNGFYTLGQLAPTEDLTYNLGDYAFFNVQPSDGKEVISPLYLDKNLEGYHGLNMNVSNIEAGKKAMFAFANLANQSPSGAFSGKVYFCLTDKDGNKKEKIDSMEISKQYALPAGYQYGVTTLLLAPKTSAVEGDRIRLYAKEDDSNEELEIKDFDGSDMSIPAYGYTPRTAEITTNIGQGATIEYDETNVLYDNKPMLGTSYVFTVTTDESVAKDFVVVNDRTKTAFDVGTKNPNKKTYAIDDMYESKYTIKVLTYPEYEEKSIALEMKPGGLEDSLRNKRIDPYIYRNITLTGQIDQRDFEVLDKYSFRKIDLSGCTVAAYQLNEADAIPTSAFLDNEALEEFEMPSGVKTVGVNSFFYTSLKKIVLPASITSLEGNCFYGCEKLADVYMYHTTPIGNISMTAFAVNGNIDNRTLHVPAGCKATYENSANREWTQFFSKIVEDVETGIQGVHVNATSDAAAKKAGIYDLNGRRIMTPVRNNTYIQNGKKFIQR